MSADQTLTDSFTDWWETYLPQGTPDALDGPLLGDQHRLFGFCPNDADVVDSAHSDNPLRVWTVIETAGHLEIVVGRRTSDCIGYFITRRPASRLCERVSLS